MPRSSRIWQAPLSEFRDAIEMRGMPGCGAAAAVSAGFGLALVLKGLRLSHARSPTPQQDALIERGDPLQDRLARYAEDDVTVFKEYLAAVERANTSRSDEHSDADVQLAIESTCRVPLMIAQGCLDGLELSVEALPETAESFRSDTLAGALLLHAGLRAVLAGLDDNLEGLENSGERDTFRLERQALEAEADNCLSRLQG